MEKIITEMTGSEIIALFSTCCWVLSVFTFLSVFAGVYVFDCLNKHLMLSKERKNRELVEQIKNDIEGE